MSHHKRGKPKDARAGCLMCKYWKSNGYKGRTKSQTMQERKAREDFRDQRGEVQCTH